MYLCCIIRAKPCRRVTGLSDNDTAEAVLQDPAWLKEGGKTKKKKGGENKQNEWKNKNMGTKGRNIKTPGWMKL